ncbi:MAG: hypothetical protein N4A33_06615 [Bacteriovoracaceae bacterium]|jgi:hypothetical protein|nr:hypothetical protein [Bacteriovoracaceae bacterium]
MTKKERVALQRISLCISLLVLSFLFTHCEVQVSSPIKEDGKVTDQKVEEDKKRVEDFVASEIKGCMIPEAFNYNKDATIAYNESCSFGSCWNDKLFTTDRYYHEVYLPDYCSGKIQAMNDIKPITAYDIKFYDPMYDYPVYQEKYDLVDKLVQEDEEQDGEDEQIELRELRVATSFAPLASDTRHFNLGIRQGHDNLDFFVAARQEAFYYHFPIKEGEDYHKIEISKNLGFKIISLKIYEEDSLVEVQPIITKGQVKDVTSKTGDLKTDFIGQMYNASGLKPNTRYKFVFKVQETFNNDIWLRDHSKPEFEVVGYGKTTLPPVVINPKPTQDQCDPYGDQSKLDQYEKVVLRADSSNKRYASAGFVADISSSRKRTIASRHYPAEIRVLAEFDLKEYMGKIKCLKTKFGGVWSNQLLVTDSYSISSYPYNQSVKDGRGKIAAPYSVFHAEADDPTYLVNTTLPKKMTRFYPFTIEPKIMGSNKFTEHSSTDFVTSLNTSGGLRFYYQDDARVDYFELTLYLKKKEEKKENPTVNQCDPYGDPKLLDNYKSVTIKADKNNRQLPSAAFDREINKNRRHGTIADDSNIPVDIALHAEFNLQDYKGKIRCLKTKFSGYWSNYLWTTDGFSFVSYPYNTALPDGGLASLAFPYSRFSAKTAVPNYLLTKNDSKRGGYAMLDFSIEPRIMDGKNIVAGAHQNFIESLNETGGMRFYYQDDARIDELEIKLYLENDELN